MSCSCSSSPCGCDSTNESLSSALNNFTTAFFGSLTKTCVNGKVSWVLPCNLEAGFSEIPRNAGEGLACYFMRISEAILTAQTVFTGNKGYRQTTLTNQNVVLFRSVDVENQDFVGTLTAPVDIYLSSNGATNGDEFYISFDGLMITNTNNLEIKSDTTTLLLLDTTGTLDGYLKAVYTTGVWKLTLTSVNIT